MGLPVSIDIPGTDDPAVLEPVFERLVQIDKRFSPYKPTSEVSKFANGEVKEKDLSPELKSAIRACRQAEKLTGGYFSAWYGGRFEPSGYVKGWAIAEAGKVIAKQGFKTYCIGAGGDILARSNGERNWSIGIQDPRDKTKILDLLSISSGAVATSGNYARGTHIINPKTHRAADELLSVTITGPDIMWADVLATAGFAMGLKILDFVQSQPDYQALIINRAGRLLTTPGLPSRSPGSSR